MQIVEWCAAGSDSNDPDAFEGVIAFDEAHRAKNLALGGGGNGSGGGSGG